MLALILTFWLFSQVANTPSNRVAIPLSASHSNSLQSGQTPEIPRGQIVEQVVCLNDRNQSYALYLPSNYQPDRKWPVLYAFDPRARGKVPLERFKDAAEKYGWIVVGSNNSRNGPLQVAVEAWNAITKDTRERFAINDDRVYVAGFSGAARAAIFMAVQCRNCVTGVIACGAGFPAGITPSSALRFAVFSVAGVEDFNFPEVKELDDAVARAGMVHRLEIFDGRHEWAPAPVAMAAVEWFELTAMKANRSSRNDQLIQSLRQKTIEQGKAFEAAKKLYEAYQLYAAAADTFKGLSDIGEIETSLTQLRNSREVQEAIRNDQRQMKKQREIEGRISGLISAKERNPASESLGSADREGATDVQLDSDTRLRGLLLELRKQSQNVEDSGDRRTARRVLEGVFVSLYEQGLDFLQAKKLYPKAVQTFTLATEVYPDRAGAFYYLAWANAANGDRKRSLRALKSAVEKGYSDLSAITNNKAFDPIRDDPQYRQIIQTLQDKH